MTKKQKPGLLNWLLDKNQDDVDQGKEDINTDNDNEWAPHYYRGETHLWHEENPQKALIQFEHALDVARRTGDRKGEGYSLEMLGEVLPATRKEQDGITYLNRAIEYSETALAISQEIGDRTLEGRVLRTLASAHMTRNGINSADYTLANEYLEKSVTVFRETANLEETANSLTSLALLLQKMGQVEYAQQVAREASQVRTNVLAKKLNK